MREISNLLRKGFRKDPADVLDVLLSLIRTKLKKGLSYVLRMFLRCLPTRQLIQLKRLISPIVKLDYAQDTIFLHVDSEWDILRAKACGKEPETVQWIQDCVKPGDIFYDIGANIGAYSFVAVKHCAGLVTVHAFDPSFSTYYQLCRNIILNHCQEHIIPHMLALAKKTGVSVFNYKSIEAGTSRHALGTNVDDKGALFEPVYRQQVLSFSIDDLVYCYGFPAPNHIKLDVDGTEFDILCGATRTLSNPCVKSILVEISHPIGHTEEIVELLTSKGFRLVSQNDHDEIRANYIFERDENR